MELGEAGVTSYNAQLQKHKQSHVHTYVSYFCICVNYTPPPKKRKTRSPYVAFSWMMLASRSYHCPNGWEPGTMQWWKMQPREKMSTACVRRDDEKLGPPAIAHDDALPPAPAPAPDTDKEL